MPIILRRRPWTIAGERASAENRTAPQPQGTAIPVYRLRQNLQRPQGPPFLSLPSESPRRRSPPSSSGQYGCPIAALSVALRRPGAPSSTGSNLPSRLWLGGVVQACRDTRRIQALAQILRQALRPGPILLSVDGFSAYLDAFLRILRSPLHTGKPGRPTPGRRGPTPPGRPPWLAVQALVRLVPVAPLSLCTSPLFFHSLQNLLAHRLRENVIDPIRSGSDGLCVQEMDNVNVLPLYDCNANRTLLYQHPIGINLHPR